MLMTCRVVMMSVKMSGPKAAMVLKMKSCPTAEQMESREAWKAKSVCRKRKPREEKKTPRNSSEPTVKIQENRFTPNIICTEETLYCLNSSDCQLEVKLSNNMYPRRMIIPAKVVSTECLLSEGSAASRNRATPSDINDAARYSCQG